MTDTADKCPQHGTAPKTAKKLRGATTAERLWEYWNDPKKRQELLAAGSAELTCPP
jgi:hypothetical protein